MSLSTHSKLIQSYVSRIDTPVSFLLLVLGKTNSVRDKLIFFSGLLLRGSNITYLYDKTSCSINITQYRLHEI